MAGKRINLSDLADEPPLQEARVPAFAEAATRSVRVEQVAPNPINTRDLSAERAKIAEIAESIRTHGQLQPCAVVSRSAFIAIFPEHEQSIGVAAFVQITGARRRAAVVQAGLATLDVTVKNQVADSRTQFIAATAAENIDREDLDPVEEARMVKLLVDESGTGKSAAERLSRTPAWVTQRLNLLKLAPQVQGALRAREISLREVRDLHTQSMEEQVEALDRWRRRKEPQLTAVNSPGHTGAPQTGGDQRARRSPIAVAIGRLGGTPDKIAANLRTALSSDELKELAAELLRDTPS